jgi:hypothetical protein
MGFLERQGAGFKEAVESVHEELASLKADCVSFEDGAKDIVTGLKRNRQTLQHHLQVRSPGAVERCGFAR